MNINTNYSVQNPVNNGSKVAFQARFISDLPVKNLEKFAKVQDMFAQKTQHYANDVLTLTLSKDPIFKDYAVLTTGKPRTKPSVVSIAMVRTTPSPKC